MSLFQIPDYSENISGRVRVLLKIIESSRVWGTRLTLLMIFLLVSVTLNEYWTLSKTLNKSLRPIMQRARDGQPQTKNPHI